MRPFVLSALLVILGVGPSSSACAEDWPQLGRDQTRNAVSPETNAPVRWQLQRPGRAGKTQPALNIRWTAQLGSSTFASPTVAGGLVWIGTNNYRPRDPQFKRDAAVLMCFRESDGQFLWQYVSPRLDDKGQEEDWPLSGINCSPLAEGDRLSFTTNRAEVVCLDITPLRQGTGEPKLLWKLDLRKELGVRPVAPAMNIGWSCSLGASYKGRIYVTTGNGAGLHGGNVASPRAPSLLCLDRDSGKVLWSDSSPGDKILHSQWSSPLVVEVAGRCQVIAAQGDGWVRSFDALSGSLLWKFDTNPKAAVWRMDLKGTRNYLPATPVFYQGLVYLANGQHAEYGTGVGHLWCIDPSRPPRNKDKDLSPVDDNFDPQAMVNKDSGLVWHYGGWVVPKPKEVEPEWHFGRTMSNVAIHDGLVIAPDLDGFIHCLDARTGKRYWKYDTQEIITASPLIVDGKVFVPTEGGDVLVLALAKEARLLAKNDVNSRCFSPVFANGTLYLAAGQQLLAIRGEGAQGRVSDRPPGHWPQWRGPDRTNVSRETGLLPQWPPSGPPLAWKATGLGEGTASVAVADGRIFTLGQRGENERVLALDESTGKTLWEVPLSPSLKENSSMRWLSQRTPTADEERLYAFTARGELVCLQSTDGKELWRKSYPRDFQGKTGNWGWCDRPLVDGDRLICVPGSSESTVIALNKKTGELLWKCAVPLGKPAGYSATVVTEVEGLRQYVVFLHGLVIGVSAAGKLLWQYDRVANATGNNYTPIVYGDHVFLASGYTKGMALLKLIPDSAKGEVRFEEVYYRRLELPPWHDGAVRVGNHVYLGARAELMCLDLPTGKTVWQEKGAVGGTVSVTCADGNLYLRSQRGEVALVAATPIGHVLRGTLRIPEAVAKPGSTAPVVAGGRLFLRDDDRLFCYDLQQKPGQPPAVPQPGPKTGNPSTDVRPSPQGREVHDVFVPTPQDVVEAMLERARVKREETVYDLGCGDGRVVVTAARKYGCKAYGCDVDPECVKLSRESVAKHQVGQLVTIEQKDLFTVDLGSADVVALYLLPRTCERLLPQLKKLRPGARIVSHAFEIPGLLADSVSKVRSGEDDLEHKVFLYTVPLQPR